MVGGTHAQGYRTLQEALFLEQESPIRTTFPQKTTRNLGQNTKQSINPGEEPERADSGGGWTHALRTQMGTAFLQENLAAAIKL